MANPENLAKSLLPHVNHNPDVLSCLANLSNDEVFTPPNVANAMLDMLPQELFQNPDVKFLDPVCKSGVFLREITKRLMAGLARTMPDLQKRLDHILHNQVYGIAITELTSLLSRRTLYCTKYPNCDYSISRFNNITGNIRYKAVQHTWRSGKCVFCGASRAQYEREAGLESHAYEFIHTDNPQEIFGDMKFDVIIGNPPYQLSDGGAKASAKPIYHLFVHNLKKLEPKYLSMIIPSRWFSGGKGLSEFRESMLNDNSIKTIVDYSNSKECFDNVDIAGGICYFLRDKHHSGECTFTNIVNGKKQTYSKRLDEFSILIRNYEAISIIRKVKSMNEQTMDKIVSSRKPFGLDTSVKPLEAGDVMLRYNKGMGKYDSNKITSGKNLINKWKTIISYVSFDHAGQVNRDGLRKVMSVVEVLPPKAVCSETYLIAGSFDNEYEAVNLQSYLKTKFARFLISQVAISQHITKDSFMFVPVQDYHYHISDEYLNEKYDLDESEIKFIDSMIMSIA